MWPFPSVAHLFKPFWPFKSPLRRRVSQIGLPLNVIVFFSLIAFDILSSIDLIFGLLRAKGTLILSNIFGILYAIFTFIGISIFKLEDFSLILWKRFF